MPTLEEQIKVVVDCRRDASMAKEAERLAEMVIGWARGEAEVLARRAATLKLESKQDIKETKDNAQKEAQQIMKEAKDNAKREVKHMV